MMMMLPHRFVIGRWLAGPRGRSTPLDVRARRLDDVRALKRNAQLFGLMSFPARNGTLYREFLLFRYSFYC